jgi:TRAP-type C4-dicarboxylate transport system permease small subunit
VKFLRTIDRFIAHCEAGLICVLLTSMILMALLQVVLRKGFDTGIHWIENVLPPLVMWVGLLGASIATTEKRHITIEIASRIIPHAGRRWLGILVNLASLFIAVILAWASVRFVMATPVDKFLLRIELLDFRLPIWWIRLIIPASFIMISLRFALKTAESAAGIEEEPGASPGEGGAKTDDSGPPPETDETKGPGEGEGANTGTQAPEEGTA